LPERTIKVFVTITFVAISQSHFVSAIFCAGVWIKRGVLLRGAADLWIVSDPITPADAVVVLGGEINTRPFEAANCWGDAHPQMIERC
jgi:hypothetical protein